MAAPRAKVRSVRSVGSDYLIELELPAGLAPPLCPASLIVDEPKWQQIVHLDAIVGPTGAVTVFRTEEKPPEDIENRIFGFQQWWSPEAAEAVEDRQRLWELAPAPQGHDHCLLDWATIGSGGEAMAWRSGNNWVCKACYQRYFVEDHLGIRHA